MSMTTTALPYWFPKLTDSAWIERVRADYPEATAGMSDGWVRDTYAQGHKYADTWDHLGDARHEYEKLADAFLDARRLALRALEAWDETVLQKSHDQMMQERMEDLRAVVSAVDNS